MLEPLSSLCVSFSIDICFIAENISISMNIMCVILCLFSALSRRVGALQISIITIIILFHLSVTNLLPFEHHAKEKLSVRTQFSETYGITSYGSGWRKDVT